MADWSSLPSDLTNRIAGCFLATNDLDHYMDFRAVCHSWRSTTADPKTSTEEPRFRCTQWAMLGEEHKFANRDDTRLFLNATTGRFLRKDLPLLRRYCLITTTSGGFVVLADRKPPHAARVLNPFTGSLTHFMAPVPTRTSLAAAVVGSSFTLVLASDSSCKVYWAHPESEAFFFEEYYCNGPPCAVLPSIAGEYAGRNDGSVLTDMYEARKTFDLPRSCEMEFRKFAVAGSVGGEILLATLEKGSHRICLGKTDTAPADQGVLEPVTNIGRHALFLGDRCLLVDADKLPSIDTNCIYYQVDSPDSFSDDIYMYDLSQGTAEKIAGSFSANPVFRQDEHPPTLIQLLVGYTMDGVPINELRWEGIPKDLDVLLSRLGDLDLDDCFND